jgi:DnaK suppressor protein
MAPDPSAFAEHLRARLAELDELSKLSEDGRAVVQFDQQSVGRLSRMDAMQAQSMALATEERRAAERARVQAALRRIETGDYGRCLNCDEEIAVRRLEIDPATALCLDCARAAG